MRAGIISLVLFAVLPSAVYAADHFVTQKNNHFNTTALKIKTGDTVHFKNDDAHYHNVFSLTEGLGFDLGSYGQNQVRKWTFDKPGKVEIECAIHPNMKLIVDVTK